MAECDEINPQPIYDQIDPLMAACLIFGAIITAMEIVCYALLPTVPRWIFIVSAVVLLVVLFAATFTMSSSLMALFLICNLLLEIPIFVVIYFATFTLCTYTDDLRYCELVESNYQCWLYTQPEGFLWTALILSFITVIVDGFLTSAIRKLRLLSKGVTSIYMGHPTCSGRRVVIEAPQQIVYATNIPTYPHQTPGYGVPQQSQPKPPEYSQSPYTMPNQAPPVYKP
ncbi:hypothetical protein Q1695_002922 [Nippostrongylus brasiliensis]|nr:hypothetical protein Q1695_002922 [Nippostrongylus brasiliensis]